jgi:hypothetical protein
VYKNHKEKQMEKNNVAVRGAAGMTVASNQKMDHEETISGGSGNPDLSEWIVRSYRGETSVEFWLNWQPSH